jgi:diadenosine tetraphosphate (Ap4A) HIT family hydrolase
MSGINRSRDCLFCQVLGVAPQDLRWHDRPLTRVPGVGAVIPGLGAFVPGYVLVFPEQHVESTLRVSRDIGEAFNDLLYHTIDSLVALFGPVTVFEHGSCSRGDLRRSACLDHAHTHILPGFYGLSSAIVDPHYGARNPISGALAADLGYLLLDEPPDGQRYGVDPGVSQYLRRCIAAKLGVPDEWDYLMFPRLDNVRETVKVFQTRSPCRQ